MQLCIESAALELLLEHAVSASDLVGHIHDSAAASTVKQLDEIVDEIVHTLTELLGNPCVVVSPMQSVRLSLAPEVGVQKAIGAAVRSRAEDVIMQITLDRAILENLREHASSAAHLVGHIDDALAVGPLAEHIDEIVHTLSELLGNPHIVAAPVPSACATFTQDVDVPGHVSRSGCSRLPTMSRDITVLALRHERGDVVNHCDAAVIVDGTLPEKSSGMES
jgi:hypothetical protein